MKRIFSALLSVALILGLSAGSIGATAEGLNLGTGQSIAGTVKTKTETVEVSATAYPQQATGMFNEINRIRKAQGLNTLVRNTNLTPAAKQRALEITVHMSHTRPDGTVWRTVDKRANGENLGIDMNNYVVVTNEGFMKSPAHKALILDGDFNSLEVYCVERDSQLYWVHLFSVQTAADISGSTQEKTPETIKPTATPTKPVTTPTADNKNPISEAIVVDLMTKVLVNNNRKTVTVDNAYSVLPTTLKLLTAAAGSAEAELRADTRTSDGNFIGRVSIYPAKITTTKEILLGVEIDNDYTKATQAFFAKWFKNDTQVVGLNQQGDFGGTVNVVAKLKVGSMDTTNLAFYAYDRATNKYFQLTDLNYQVDSNGFVHFDTAVGGDIVISNGILVK